MNNHDFAILQNLLNEWLGAGESAFEPTEQQRFTLRKFVELANRSEEWRLALLKEALEFGIGPDDLIKLKNLHHDIQISDKWGRMQEWEAENS